MSDIPAEAVEAAARALSAHWRDMHTNEALGRQRMLAEAALAGAAPHIEAQATKDDPRKVAHIECDCVPDLGPSHCHLCSERAGREMPWTEAHPDLRAGIEALRDDWLSDESNCARTPEGDAESRTLTECAEALDALLLERAR